tara:strand:+ start:357 stop:623 length:267 start_codon:yes stop_codon:yes gene_type:complete
MDDTRVALDLARVAIGSIRVERNHMLYIWIHIGGLVFHNIGHLSCYLAPMENTKELSSFAERIRTRIDGFVIQPTGIVLAHLSYLYLQ